MAKKETKKPDKSKEKDSKKNKGQAQAAPQQPGQTSAPGVPPAGGPAVNSNGIPSTGIPNAGQPSIPLSAMMPEQMTAAQLEQAIKESNDPQSRLKKLHSPITVKSCLLNLLILIVMTLVIVVIWCYIAVDKFNFGTVFSDMMYEFKITQGFQWLWAQIKGWFN